MSKKKINNDIVCTDALLKLVGIKKDYIVSKDSEPVHALKGIDISFRKNEFVSILGPSGCGKTTLLNIIGGLDKYNDGDLIIDNKSTSTYTDRDWDVYRNHRIGFVFQSYNLIPHQTILGNVELALTIAGLSKKERIEKAKKAIDRVGLAGLYDKKPNQLSGGQCQRIAIARALVNEPDILLADEPTGALDTVTSKQIMDLIKEISSEKLVIMVTHNPEIAEIYSSRIIRLLDGEVIEDSNPFEDKVIEKNLPSVTVNEKAKMSWWTAFKLSFRNLYSKLKRTVLVCVAGSIGIVGVSAVLAVSAGVHNYIDSMQDDMLSGNPITIQETTFDINSLMNNMSDVEIAEIVKQNGYVDVNSMIKQIYDRAQTMNSYTVNNNITQEYIDYVCAMDPTYYADIYLDYGLDLGNNIYTNITLDKDVDGTLVPTKQYMSINAITTMYASMLSKTEFGNYASMISQLDNAFIQAPDNNDYILSQYDLLAGDVARNEDEVMLVVSRNRQLTDIFLGQIGYYTQEEFDNIIFKYYDTTKYDESLDKNEFSYDELLDKEFTWYPNDVIFNSQTINPINPFTYNPYIEESFTDGIPLKITGILEAKESISYGCLSTGFYYTKALTNKILEKNLNSEIVTFYKDKEMSDITSGEYTDINTGMKFNTGVTYNYSYEFNGAHYDEIGYLGKENAMNSLFEMMKGMMGMGDSTGNNKYYTVSLRQLGGNNLANRITIYPTNFDLKDYVNDYLDKWNSDEDIIVNDTTIVKDDRSKITYDDTLALVIALINTMIDIVTVSLIVFTALSLVVSTVMIGIITYVSVVERVKEIGVIRALGGRKKDVSHLFNAETFIIGLVSGVFGILITLLIQVFVNIILTVKFDVAIVSLQTKDAIIMIIVSIILTLISGLIPSRAAAKKNPVEALRSE